MTRKLKTILLCTATGLSILILALGSTILFSSGISAAAIKTLTLQAADTITSYRFTMQMTMAYAATQYGMNYSTLLYGTGAVDLIHHSLQMHNTVSMTSLSSLAMTIDYYLVNNTLYMTMQNGSQGATWMKMNATTTNQQWSALNQIQNQLVMLQNSTVERLPDDTIDGVPCQVLKITPDVATLLQYLLSQQATQSMQTPQITPEMIQLYKNMITTLTVKCWTSVDTHLVQQVTQNITMNMMGMSMTMNCILHFYDYNIPLSIILPEEAKNAVPYENYQSHLNGYPSKDN